MSANRILTSLRSARQLAEWKPYVISLKDSQQTYLPSFLSLFIVRPTLPSNLPAIISRRAQMLVRVAKEGSTLEHGVCPIRPPDRPSS